MLERVIYVSRAAAGTGSGDVAAIARAARARNEVLGISGGLVLHDGWFIQVLEGPAKAVHATYARIAEDPRHGEVTIRSRDRALCRLFGDQSTGLRTKTDLDPAVLKAFDYRDGFPVEDFPVDDLLEFMVCACWPDRGLVPLDRVNTVS